MPSFNAGGGTTTPFGRNEYLYSTKNRQLDSWTLAKSTIPSQTIDGNAGQKILQPGTLLAKITAAGADQGKVGPFQADATDGRQTAANVVGVNDTFLPWQTIERDVEVAVMYAGAVYQPWCIEFAAGPVAQALSDATVTAIAGIGRLKNLSFQK